jgi:hypothetical protein
MRSRCTCQNGLERWRWWAQTHGGFSSHGGMFRSMYAGCVLKATSVWHNLYAPWMPSRCTCQIGLKRSHSWEHIHFVLVLSETLIRYVLQDVCKIWPLQRPQSDTANMPLICPMNAITLHLSDRSKMLPFMRTDVHSPCSLWPLFPWAL